ncbi:Putative ribosome-binding factor A, mitochondrial [Tupaia chinensis]|uniref:Putative ribosome-binding factor A, mitochondrial n=1 Tax=Tupaia chinensis TaxID=246437 RepID=L8YC37_TUPCH|nr:Putative ribosome-binding factor A, mitochondrial [Tupaia chinensis]
MRDSATLATSHGASPVCLLQDCSGAKLRKARQSCRAGPLTPRKKFWYEGPSLGSYLAGKPSKSEAFVKAPRKTRREDHVRLWALNGLLHKALADLLCTPEVSPEVCDLSVELSKVSLSPDFSACRVYWRTSLSAEQNARTQAALQRSAPHLRHLLMAQQTLRAVPPIVFVQDRESAAQAEVDQLLAVADFGPPGDRDDAQNDSSSCLLVGSGARSPEVSEKCVLEGAVQGLHLAVGPLLV